MKNHIFSIFAVIALALGFASCNDDAWNPGGEGSQAQGTLSLKGLGVDIDDKEQQVATSRASVDLNPFIIEIKKGDAVVQKWTYALMPEIITLGEGEYTVNVVSHELQDAEWDHPYYKGSKSFTITKGEVTEIGTVTCSFQSVRVSVTFTPELLKAMDDDCKVQVEVGNSGTMLEFDKEHYSSSAYFRPVDGSMTLVATFKGTVQGNYTETTPQTFTDVAAGKHYRLNFSAKGPNPVIPEETGTIDVGSGIALDTDILGRENVNGNVEGGEEDPDNGKKHPGQEDPKPDPGPGPGPDDPTPDEGKIEITCGTLSFDSPNSLSGTLPSGKVNLHADNKIAHLKVKISTNNAGFESAVSEFLPLEFDLADTKGSGMDAQTVKESLGFPVDDEVVGQTDLVFDITDFLPLLAGFDGEHKFQITVVDTKGKSESKTLTFVK